jgi:hypothetical protein
MYRRLFSFSLLLVLTTATFAQRGQPPMGQTEMRPGTVPDALTQTDTKSIVDLATKKRRVLSNYCRLDFDGARLSPEGWNRFEPYTSISANPDYRRLVIVSRFSVEPPEESAELLYVNYQDEGYYDDRGGYVASSAKERVEFQVEEKNNDAVVARVSTEMPHVSPRAAITWMTQRLSDPKTSEANRTRLKDAIEQLTKLIPQPIPQLTPQPSPTAQGK